MENNKIKNKDLPCFVSTNDYSESLSMTKRKILPNSNIANYLSLLDKSNLDSNYFYSENVQKIMQESIKIK